MANERAEAVRINFGVWPDIIAVTYTNWRGITATRRLRPRALRFGSTEWHPEPQWLMSAEDIDKNEIREFALRDMVPFEVRPHGQ